MSNFTVRFRALGTAFECVYFAVSFFVALTFFSFTYQITGKYEFSILS
jgi:hypothetical protein